MSTRIRVICDNTAGALAGTLGEHGFAALVERDGDSFLFDTGGGHTLLHNAQRMNLDLKAVPQVILSHGHYDHTGGLWPLLQACGPKRVLAHPDVFAHRYALREGNYKAIGLPYSQEFLEGAGATFSFSDGFREVASGIYLTGEVPRVTPFEEGDTGLFCDLSGCRRDSIVDDQSLVIQTKKGLLLLLGCCHAGVINTVEYARAQTGVEEIYGIVGGCHLAFSSRTQIDSTIKTLKRYGLKKICAGHCTGFEASALLLKEFPPFKPAHVGYTIEAE